MSKRMKPARIEIYAGGGTPIEVELTEVDGGIGLAIRAGKGRLTLVLSPLGDAARGVAAWLDAYAGRHGLPAPPPSAAAPPAPPPTPGKPGGTGVSPPSVPAQPAKPKRAARSKPKK